VFQVALAIVDGFAQGITELWESKLRGTGFPEQRDYASYPKSFRSARTYWMSSITTPSLVRPGFFFVYHVSDATVVNDGNCAHDFALKALEYRNTFDTVGYGKVCGCTPRTPFSVSRQLVTAQNAEDKKRQSLGVSAALVRQNKLIEMKFDT